MLISDLPSTTPTGAMVLPVEVDGGATYKSTVSDLVGAGASGLSLSDIGEQKTVAANGNTTFTLANSKRYVTVSSGAGAAGKFILIINVASNGTVTHADINLASSVTITTATRSITIANGTSTAFYATLLEL